MPGLRPYMTWAVGGTHQDKMEKRMFLDTKAYRPGLGTYSPNGRG